MSFSRIVQKVGPRSHACLHARPAQQFKFITAVAGQIAKNRCNGAGRAPAGRGRGHGRGQGHAQTNEWTHHLVRKVTTRQITMEAVLVPTDKDIVINSSSEEEASLSDSDNQLVGVSQSQPNTKPSATSKPSEAPSRIKAQQQAQQLYRSTSMPVLGASAKRTDENGDLPLHLLLRCGEV
jgi:hypothetical protein